MGAHGDAGKAGDARPAAAICGGSHRLGGPEAGLGRGSSSACGYWQDTIGADYVVHREGTMTDHAAWLARILETHPDVVHVDGATETLIKRDELLVLDTHADEVHDKARRWVDSREDSAAPGRADL